ncbi:MAG TPA: aminotransferase class V-fold PLP-dependent enzyme [Clostridia bacterium]|nr:aminotransferase class V-fold PLP-dependent enzyme [Clostridia bacterium]
MVYLDNAATTFPKPASVNRAVYRFLTDKAANPGRSGHQLAMASSEEVYRCRKLAAEFFNAPGPECVAFTMNATMAINMALKGRLTGGHVVTSNLEHNSVMRPLSRLAKLGVTFSTAQVDLASDEQTLENIEKLIGRDTVMVACTHASNVCGRSLPIKQIGRLCKSRGIEFLLDASQSAGILPIDMQNCCIDYLCMPGHKSLYGPMGTGMLITSKGETLETITEGGTGSKSVSFDQPDFMPDRMESGTVNAPGIAGLRAGMNYVRKRGIDTIFREEMKLYLMAYDLLSELDGIRLYNPRPVQGYVPVLGFNIGEMPSEQAVIDLDHLGIALRGGLHCSPAAHQAFGTLSQGMIRASFGAFNRREDVFALTDGVQKIMKRAKIL